MSEDEVMRKRLTVEGDGGSDDKRIMSLVKTFVRWSQTSALNEEEVDATYQKMLFTLGWSKCINIIQWYLTIPDTFDQLMCPD